MLTPLGDPPLFLGFLRGVPFLWTFQLVGPWALVNGVLLVVFNLLDQRVLDARGEGAAGLAARRGEEIKEPLRIDGRHQLPVAGSA